MGCDGGSIPHRSEMVRKKPKQEKIDKQAQKIAQWTICALSKNQLTQPIVSCGLGKLYNRESILEYLINPESYGESNIICPHIKSLKDVTTLSVQENVDNGDKSTSFKATRETASVVKFVCKVTMREMNGTTRFCYLHKCGCLMSESAITEVKSTVCLVCGTEYEKDDIIPIYPDREDDVIRLKARIERIHQERALLAADKKSKKKKRSADTSTIDNGKKPKLETINSSMKLPVLSDEILLKHKNIESLSVQNLYIPASNGFVKLTTPLFSGSFSRRN